MNAIELTAPYRSDHSLSVGETKHVLDSLRERSFIVDYGCHFGHLSFALAVLNPCFVVAVDNFTGTPDDAWMSKTIREATGGENFFGLFVKNYMEMRTHFQGKVLPLYSKDFWESEFAPDAIFIDSSHRPEDDWEFESLWKMLAPGGILMGHDYTNSGSPNVKVAVDALAHKHDLILTTSGMVFTLREK